MNHITNRTPISLRISIILLITFVWAMPLLADFNLPTRFGTNNPNKVDNPNVEAERKNNFDYKAYQSTIYDPFGNQTPSSGGGGNPANDDGNGSGEDVGIPDWADTPSEPLPIADGTIFLLLIAATMITIIAIKQRRQKQLQSIITNNNPAQRMTTRKQTYQSLFQKLFLLLAFVCIAGQVSAKVIYFRPSTITIGNNGSNWCKMTDKAWFAMLRTNNYNNHTHYQWHVLNSGTPTTDDYYASKYIYQEARGKKSRFLGFTIDDGNDGFAFYRINDNGNGDYNTSNQFNPTTTKPGSGIYNCIPNNEWWTRSGVEDKWYGRMFCWDSNLAGIAKGWNLIGVQEGEWGGEEWEDGYYLAFYVVNDVHLYFANTNNWTTPMFARGKDVYSYKDEATRIPNTKLYYTKLAGSTDIAYRKYAYFDDTTGKWDELETLWKDYQYTDATKKYTTKTEVNKNKLDTRLSGFTRKSQTFDGIRLDYNDGYNKSSSYKTSYLFKPNSSTNNNVTQTKINGYNALNHTQTIIVESGGKLNYQTTKLTGEGIHDTYSDKDKTGTVTFTAAYTATTILRAKPIDGYYFLGFFDAAGKLLSRGTTDEEPGFIYRYEAPNDDTKTIKARFAPLSSRKLLRVQILKLDKGSGWSLWTDTTSSGNSITIKYTDIVTGNPLEYTFDKYITENVSDWVFPITEYINGDNSIGYPSICIENISPGHPVTLTANNNSEKGYVFVGWWYASAGRPDNPWEITDISDYNSTEQPYFTARFAKVVQHTINVHTYNQEQNKYVLSEEGGYVEIVYRELTAASVGGYQNCTTSVALTNTYPIPYNSTPTLTATPKEGYSFVGWYEGDKLVSTTPKYSGVKANTDRNITARFTLAQQTHAIAIMTYDPTYNEYKPVNPGGSVTYTTKIANESQLETVSGTTETATTFTAANTQTVTLSATAKTEYDFIGFYEGETLLAEGGEEAKAYTYSYTATTKGRYITARFAPKQSHPIILVPNSAGTYTIRFGKDKTKPENMYSKESSLTDTVITYAPYSYFYTVTSAKPILGYKFDHHDAAPRSTNESYWKEFGKYHSEARTDTSYVVVSFLRDEDQVVYLDLNGQWARDSYTSYWVYAYDTTNIYHKRDKQDNTTILRYGTYTWLPMTPITANSLYSCTIPRNKYSHIMFVQLKNDVLEAPTHTIESYKGQNLNTTKFFTIPATRMNCMKLKSAYNSSTGGYEDMWTEPPTEIGDFRLVYIEQTAENQDNITVDYTFDDAGLIKKKANSLDTISLHIYNEVSNGIDGTNNPEILLQKCTAMVGNKWETIERRMIFGPLYFTNNNAIKMPSRRNASTATLVIDGGIDIIKTNDQDNGSGVWNFVISQDGNGNATILANETHRYLGDYYIRTTNAPGQYYQYTHPGNIMTYSAYAAAHSDYTDYFIRYVDINEDGTPTVEAGKHPNLKFAIANDHSVYLNNEFMINNKYGDDPFVVNNENAPYLPADASVRFGWDRVTNHLTRAYIANTALQNNEYLVIEGENIGDATYFTDNSNWLYSIDLNATASATAKVKAKMNGQYQYFMGAKSENETLISGNGEGTYPIRLLYDFKDDRFTTIYHPQGTISGATDLQTPVMIEREHNYAPTQITFETSATIKATGTGEDQYTHPAYAVMTFLGNILTDPAITHHEKMFYWVSFPFDVKISEVFGLGKYGKYWIMQRYDGAQRAQHGLKYTNWKYITNTADILEANIGYVICLNYSQLVTDSVITKNNKVSLYFPSKDVISPADISLQTDPVVVELKAWQAGANIAWNHLNWHLIGVPSFATPGLTYTQTEMPFLYEYWHPGDAYAAIANVDPNSFLPMHSYMVQYAGDIIWNSVVNTTPPSLTARRDAAAEDKPVMLRLELQQAGNTIDKTFVQLRNDKGTLGFDLNLDLSKIINAGSNIYSVVSGDQMAGNAIPKEETVLPIGVVTSAAGEYTFAMPRGTEGMLVELIDYEQSTATNLLLSDYIVTLSKGTFDQRFALRLKPDKVATSVDNIGNEASGNETVRKLLIDGMLYMQRGNLLYDAQGRIIFNR